MSLRRKFHRSFSNLAASRLDFKTHATVHSATSVSEAFVYSAIEKTLSVENSMFRHPIVEFDIVAQAVGYPIGSTSTQHVMIVFVVTIDRKIRTDCRFTLTLTYLTYTFGSMEDMIVPIA
jgi:hypothetical protein